MQAELLEMALNYGADSAGWASLDDVDLIKFSLLPESEANRYRSALVIAKKHKPSALKDLSGMPTKAYDRDYRRLNRELSAVVQALENDLKENGIECRTVPPSETLDNQAQRGLISHKALAEKAGIGVRGRNNLVISSPPFPAMRLCSLLTEIPVEDSPAPSSQDPCEECDLCINLCPVNAVGPSWRDYNLERCLEHLDRIASPNISPQICGVCLAACPQY
jgi:epoxyqueuosine reductase QueG